MVGTQVLVQNLLMPKSVSRSPVVLPGENSREQDWGLTLSQLTISESVLAASPVLATSLPLSVALSAFLLAAQQD